MGTSSAPVYPFPGGAPGEPPDPVAGEGGHIAWSDWIKKFITNLDTQSAKRSGDTFSGVLESVVNMGQANLLLKYDGAPGVVLRGTTAGLQVLNAAMDANVPVHVATPTQTDHAVTKEYADALSDSALYSALPTGSIVMFATNTPPTGWLMCDGTSTTGHPELAAIVGANTPDLRDRFIVGAGGAYAQGATGGADSVTLTANQSGLPAHGHSLSTDNADAVHSHSANPGGFSSGAMSANAVHSHSAVSGDGAHSHNHYASNVLTAEGDFNPAGSGYKYLATPAGTENIITGGSHTHAVTVYSVNTDHTHWIDVPSFTSGTSSVSHSHSGSTDNNAAAPAAASHENRPPYYALTFIIKAV